MSMSISISISTSTSTNTIMHIFIWVTQGRYMYGVLSVQHGTHTHNLFYEYYICIFRKTS